MKPRLPSLCQVRLLLAALSATAAASPPPKAPAPPTDEIAQRIDALLKRRLNPDPLPSVLPNPFVIVTTGSVSLDRSDSDVAPAKPGTRAPTDPTLAAPVVAATPQSSDIDVLEHCAAELRIGGLIQQKDEVQIFINGIPKREGEIVVVDQGDGIVSVEVVRIMPHSLVLGLNGARATLKF